MNVIMMLIIQRLKFPRNLSAYRVIFLDSAVDAVCCGAHVTVVAATHRTPKVHLTLNSIALILCFLYGIINDAVCPAGEIESM
ncbi:hypothetical protein KIN20_009500 [Parelaphostrongylus tenuis]|uniref:Uncharacterized protein n=1 Tax=Parelaphostrongylus tenuis TaxID=148309 RepID=A0AAD5M6F8_PARTN|nr:hypothetical protein KIN20_009500 [Parelaphostrongylus tenuis]